MRVGSLRSGPIVAALLLVVGCGGSDANPREGEAGAPPTSTTSIEVSDDAGREWRFDRPPDRVISLVPSTTGILLALDLEDRLVARTDFDRHPALSSLPSVGGGLNPSLERVVGADPELVIRFEGPSDRATPETLDRLGIPHLAVRPDTIGDIDRIVGMVARVMGVPERGDRLRQSIRSGLDSVRAAVQGRPRPRVAFLLGGDPPWVAGSGTFLHELVEIAGGRNVFGDTGPLYAPVSVEEIIERDPELILITEGARLPQALESLPVRRVPESIQSPGVEVAGSAETLARILHPGALP